MDQILAILTAKSRISKHTVASIRYESKLKVAVVGISAVVLWIGGFILFYFGFDFLKQQGADILGGADAFIIGRVLMARLLAVFAMALFFMLIFSNVLISFSTLYKAHEVKYLVHSPIRYSDYFLARFTEIVSFSSWASAYLGSPLILAYGLVEGAPLRFFAAAFLYYLPFVVIPAAIGAIIAMVLVRVFPRLGTGAMIALGVAVVIAGGLFFYYRINAQQLSDADLALAIFEAAGQTQSPWLPSFWAAKGVLLAGAGEYGEAAFFWLMLTANACFATLIAAAMAGAIFYPGWTYLMGQDRTRERPMNKGVFAWISKLLAPIPNPLNVLTIKDIKLFWRDPAQWSQFVIFFGLMAIYMANVREDQMGATSPMWRNWIICLNLGACTLILATLTSRFVFPLVSLEGRRFWILGLAPLTFRQLIWQKFWLSVVTTSLFTVGLVILTCLRLRVDALAFGLSLYSIVVTNFALSGLAVGLGSLYPNFQEDNPARIVGGMGGTLNFLLSVGYIILVVGALTFLLQGRVIELFPTPASFYATLAGVVAFTLILSLVSWLVPMRYGLRNLEQHEF